MRLVICFITLALSAMSAMSAMSGLAWAEKVVDPNTIQIQERLTGINPQIRILSVRPAAIAGLYEVELESGELLYSSADAGHFLLGQLFQVNDSGFVNLSEVRKKQMRIQSLAALSRDDMVIFPAEGELKSTVYAFTDVDCGYCRKLHSEINEYSKLGIEIRYLAFPRAGIDSSSYDKMVSVWCAEDPRQAMTDSKAGRPIAAKTCDNAVAEQYELGQKLGVTGTPALLFEDGSLMPGYVPAQRLAAFLEVN